MFELIARLRQRPPHERRRISFLTALTITGIIAILWVVSLFVRFGSTDSEVKTTTAPSPTQSVMTQIRGAFDSFRKNF